MGNKAQESKMSKFDPKLFNKDSEYLMYNGLFVARFKRGGMADFRKFLVKNFSVEEYFALRDKDVAR